MKTNKLFTFLLLGLFMISFASAFEFDNKMDYNRNTDTISFQNRWGNKFIGGGVVAEAKLEENICKDGKFCHATKTIKLNEEMPLIEDFKTLRVDDDSWEDQDIRYHKLEYWGEIEDYKEECKQEEVVQKNGTSYINSCERILIGSHEGWIEFKEGDIFPEGEYKVKTSGEIKPGRVYDWQVMINGDWTTPWSIWGNISEGDDSEVILNSPADGLTIYTSELTFNATANVTGGASLTNMSLWTNETGTWEIRNTTELDDVSQDITWTSTGTSSTALTWGFQITANQNTQITALEKASTANPTTAVLQTSTGSTIATATFVGDTATFSTPQNITSGTTYRIVGNSGGASYTNDGNGNIYPQTGTYFDIDTGIDSNGNGASWGSWIFTGIIIEINPSSQTQTWERPLVASSIWNVEACDTDGACGFAESNYTFFTDTTAPTIEVESPNGTLEYNSIDNNETLNVTFTDEGLETCWYDYNGTNVTIDGCLTGVKNSTNFILEEGNYNMTVYANDSIGNLNSEFVEWDYKILVNSFTYSNETLSGNQEDFILNLTLKDGLDLTSSTFMWNGYEIEPSVTSIGQIRTISVINYTIPSYDIDTNISINFNFILDDSTEINTTEEIQLVRAVYLDNCSSYTNRLFNISLYDEKTINSINGDIELIYTLLNKNYDTIKVYNFSADSINNTYVCSEINLSDEDLYYSAEIRYNSENYTSELYHIQRAAVGYDMQQINLYDLNSCSSTEFKVTYQDSTFNFIKDAIIQLQRKYISENLYRVVEAPLTSSEGVSILHIDLDSVKYRATVVKNGIVLDEFDNLVFKCESELTGECEYKLLGEIDPQNDLDLENVLDFSYFEPVLSNGSIITSFNIPSNTPSEINVILEQKDVYGNTTLYNETITSSAGSISAEYSDFLEESYIDLTIYKDGVPMVAKTYILDPEGGLDWLGNNYIFIVVILFSLVGMALSSPEWIIINGIITMVIAGGLWLAGGLDFVVGLGSIMWLVIAAIILIAKISKQEDR